MSKKVLWIVTICLFNPAGYSRFACFATLDDYLNQSANFPMNSNRSGTSLRQHPGRKFAG